MISAMNHFTILAEDRQKTLDFYLGVLGLQDGHRPDLGFPGAWLHAGDGQPILHIVFGRPLPTQRSGVIDHMAFSAQGLPATTAKLTAAGIKFSLNRQAESGIWQLFCFDPNGARVELDFNPTETP